MGKTLGWNSWLLIVFLLLTMLIPMGLMAKPAHAQDPDYGAMAQQLQLNRQQLAEQIALSQSAEFKFMYPQGRASVKAQLAAAQQLYPEFVEVTLATYPRADEEIRRMGYTSTQLLQMSSTLEGTLRMLDILISALQNLAGSAKAPLTTATPTPTEPEKTTAPPQITAPAKTTPPTTTTEPPVTPPTKLTEGAVLTGISGAVYVRKGGTGEWTRYDRWTYDQTVLKPGDEVRTGENGKVVIEFANGDRIELGLRTHFTILD